MSRIGILSDIHAGLGEHDESLRNLQRTAVQRATSYLEQQNIDMLILNGDTTDHIANVLSAGTNPEIAREVLAPIANLLAQRRGALSTVLLAGNTDWPIADPDPEIQKLFFDMTGLPLESVVIPHGLWHAIETDDTSITVTHGHALKPEYWQQKQPLPQNEEVKFWDRLRNPPSDFLKTISATTGAHRNDYLKAVVVGSVVKMLPGIARRKINTLLGQKFTREYEEHFAEALTVKRTRTQRRVLGVMGHTHVAGIRQYQGEIILNTGTTGAKPNPLQRRSDPLAHLAIIDTEKGSFELVQTLNAARKNAKPETVKKGSFTDL